MARKQIVLVEGFIITGKKVVPCHFKNITTKDTWGEKSSEKIVLVDGIIGIVGNHKNEVFLWEQDAINELSEKNKRHLKFCKEQVEYYQEQLDR